MDLRRGASKEDRRGNMYENEQSNVPRASILTEKGCCKIQPPLNIIALGDTSLVMVPSKPPGIKDLSLCSRRNNNNTIRHTDTGRCMYTQMQAEPNI